MPSYGTSSRMRLATCCPDIQRVFNEIIKHFDCSIICGFRGRLEQEEVFRDGKSKARFGESPHNFTFGVDVVPYPIDWRSEKELRAAVESGNKKEAISILHNMERWAYFAGQVIATARNMGIKLKWGGDWSNDTELKDNGFDDLPHFELLNWRELK